MRLAAVDIGSNTVHVLVADAVRGRLEDVAHYVEMPELGARVARKGEIGPGTKTAIRALRSVVARARTHGFEVLIAGATEAVRQAKDGAQFATAAGAAIGTTIHVITATREAELSFQGVASRHSVRREWAMVDLGGGSTEVVIARGRPSRAGSCARRRGRAAGRHRRDGFQPAAGADPPQPAVGADDGRPIGLRSATRPGPGGQGGNSRRAAREPGQSDAGRRRSSAAVPRLVWPRAASNQPRGPAPRDAP